MAGADAVSCAAMACGVHPSKVEAIVYVAASASVSTGLSESIVPLRAEMLRGLRFITLFSASFEPYSWKRSLQPVVMACQPAELGRLLNVVLRYVAAGLSPHGRPR